MRALYDFEAKLVRIDAAKQKVVDIDRVEQMIAGGLRAGAGGHGQVAGAGPGSGRRRSD